MKDKFKVTVFDLDPGGGGNQRNVCEIANYPENRSSYHVQTCEIGKMVKRAIFNFHVKTAYISHSVMFPRYWH